uniref:Uncharacterized protein n=1 Tax=Nymphaea colorata TaxID=210225 RepID=A0A5K0V726_9MAGN
MVPFNAFLSPSLSAEYIVSQLSRVTSSLTAITSDQVFRCPLFPPLSSTRTRRTMP